jgi:putative transcriptional regulator
VRGSSRGATATPVGGGVSLVSTREGLESLIASTASATEFRVYVGYAGWGPGQLEAETARGSWHVLEGDADVVFDDEPASTWQRQIARTEGLRAHATMPREAQPGSIRSARRS